MAHRRCPPKALQAAPMVACVLVAALWMFGAPQPAPIRDSMPVPVQWAWFLCLGIGGVVALAGMYWPYLIEGAVLERFGVRIASCGSALYALALFLNGGASAWSGVMWTAVAVLGWWHAIQVTREVRGGGDR